MLCCCSNGSTIAQFTLSCVKSSQDIDDETLKTAMTALLMESVSDNQTRAVFYHVLNASVSLISLNVISTTAAEPTAENTTFTTSNYSATAAVTNAGNTAANSTITTASAAVIDADNTTDGSPTATICPADTADLNVTDNATANSTDHCVTPPSEVVDSSSHGNQTVPPPAANYTLDFTTLSTTTGDSYSNFTDTIDSTEFNATMTDRPNS